MERIKKNVNRGITVYLRMWQTSVLMLCACTWKYGCANIGVIMHTFSEDVQVDFTMLPASCVVLLACAFVNAFVSAMVTVPAAAVLSSLIRS